MALSLTSGSVGGLAPRCDWRSLLLLCFAFLIESMGLLEMWVVSDSSDALLSLASGPKKVGVPGGDVASAMVAVSGSGCDGGASCAANGTSASEVATRPTMRQPLGTSPKKV